MWKCTMKRLTNGADFVIVLSSTDSRGSNFKVLRQPTWKSTSHVGGERDVCLDHLRSGVSSSPSLMDYGDSRMNSERSKVDATALYVSVNDAGKSYRSFNGKKRLVFERVSLVLPRGTVYGLLGPSGCGKTSLIKCILGRLNLDEGSIVVFGHCPGTVESGVPGPSVGYMPQETCIPKTLTIGQCWTYYGTILGMSKKKINDAIGYFIQLLHLPPATTVNDQLSGGELRRVAFATALIHEPKLLILDEPTVGIDCITKKSMWEHLLKLANENNTSIILTTHYIEEAMSAHKVGLMHGGTLAVEDYTENLLQKFGCDTLESVFLKICTNSNENADCAQEVKEESTDVWIPMKKNEPVRVQNSAIDGVADAALPEHTRQKVKKGCLRSLSWRDFHIRLFVLNAVISKNWIHLYRFPGVLIFILTLPCIQVFSSIFSFKEVVGQTQLALINRDSGLLGNQYLTYLNPEIISLQSFNSDVSALEALSGGNVCGVIVIRQNFSEAHLDRIINSPLARATIMNDSVIRVTLDHTCAQSKFIGLHLMDAYERFLYAAYNETGLNDLSGRPVIYFERVVIEYILVPSNVNCAIAVITMTSFYAPFAVAVLTLFVDFHHGHLETSVVAGVTSAEIVLGLLVILMVCGFVQLLLTLIIGFLFAFHVFTWGPFFLMLIVLYIHGLNGMAADWKNKHESRALKVLLKQNRWDYFVEITQEGIFLSMVFGEIQVMLVFIGNVIMFSGASSGGFWPLVSIPSFFRGVFLALPVAYQVRAVAAIYNGASFYISEMLCSITLSLTYTIVLITLSMLLLRIKT